MIQKKRQFFYKFSLLKQYNTSGPSDIINVNVTTGPIFSSKNACKQIGNLLIEQIYNIKTGKAKTVYNVELKEGILNFIVFSDSNEGKLISNNTYVGPVDYGTKRFLFWNSSHYFSKVNVLSDDNTREVTIFKKIDGC
jgi:hypothetical protein